MTRWIAVTLLLAVLAVVLKFRLRGTTTTRSIKVTSRITVSRSAIIAVVEVDGQRLLVGAGANQVTLLSVLPTTGPEAPLAARTDATPIPPGLEHVVAPGKPRRAKPSAGQVRESSSLLDKARRMTTRTADVQLRLPKRTDPAL